MKPFPHTQTSSTRLSTHIQDAPSWANLSLTPHGPLYRLAFFNVCQLGFNPADFGFSVLVRSEVHQGSVRRFSVGKDFCIHTIKVGVLMGAGTKESG